MSMPLTINHIYFMEILKNYDSTFNAAPIRTYSQPTSNGIFVKVGRAVGKTSRFLKKSETKVSALVAHWSVETLIFIAATFAVSSVPMIMLITGWYLFETYAIFSAIMALVTY
jgi:hypothetical protein